MRAQNKPWYKHWWGVILAILIWPIFLIWLLWSKSEKTNGVKIAGTVGIGFLAIMSLVVLAAILPSTPPSQPVASKVAVKTVPVVKHTTKPPQKASTAVKTTPKPTTPKPTLPVLTGFGATQDEWNKTHNADTRATANSSYDPGNGLTDCSNFGDKYYGMAGTSDYGMCFPNGQSLATTQAIVMQEFPADTTILWQGKQTNDEPSECYQMEVHSATLAEVLGTDGDAFVEFETLDPNNTSGNIEYMPSNVNDASLIDTDNASLSSANGC
jgi:hypothetical protein